MTTHRDLKTIIRERQAKTGESYTAARVHVMRARAERLGLPPGAPIREPLARVEAAVIRRNHRSARVRILGEDSYVTLRAKGIWRAAPGQIATLTLTRRWTYRGHACAVGVVEDVKTDVAKLGLAPLPLCANGLEDVARICEPYRRPDPYAPLWKRLTAKPRPSFDMHPIAWDAAAFHAGDADETPVCKAAELIERGDVETARELLMDVLSVDLRCIDAHARLGDLVFHRSPEEAIVHYDVGVKIGELSLGPTFDGLLLWGRLENRPFLRCLQGVGLCLWRLGRIGEARLVFERILAMNPNDNQGARFCWLDLQRGRTWEEGCAGESSALH